MINETYETKKEDNLITVTNFLDDVFIDKIYNDMCNIDMTWWYISMYPINENNEKENTRYHHTILLDETYNEQNSYNYTHFNLGNFAYRFKRSINDHFETCVCVQCKLRRYFDSDEIKEELTKIVGEKVITMRETFCSKYENGDYLSIHHDKNNGDYAFVFQLTKDWNPSYGGLLNFYDSDTKEVYKTINPKFNSLTIFKIKNVPKTDHFVSMNVSSNTRYAFTGWFSVA
jgi:Rps23 Pro-64 3,4-dihydroxylase Tpa1-like proline 4-hydroxylase